DADNLGDYQSVLTSTHTNCLIRLLKSVWLRAFVSTEARILRFPQSLSSVCFEVFFEAAFLSKAFNFNCHLTRSKCIAAGGE
ncbi:hypothetical protein NJF44_23140, partial [Pseudomonas guariconensis]|nr:hypothetical protein [Pseudomonas mosselii]MCO7608134.1 hypothetical protein [Pseudomonas guariconensis]MCO7619391.1 hypothetical protein [Pseudomonas guariconensis]MCO7637218.1 hypothetical protein [Pseudomonas sp. S 311-6]